MSSLSRRSADSSDGNELIDFAPLVALAGQVVQALPASAPAGWRGSTYRAVLTALVRDRVENGTELEDGDVTSLEEFVRVAAAAASAAPSEHRDDAYDIVLQGLLEDWVENWNEEEELVEEEEVEEEDDDEADL